MTASVVVRKKKGACESEREWVCEGERGGKERMLLEPFCKWHYSRLCKQRHIFPKQISINKREEGGPQKKKMIIILVPVVVVVVVFLKKHFFTISIRNWASTTTAAATSSPLPLLHFETSLRPVLCVTNIYEWCDWSSVITCVPFKHWEQKVRSCTNCFLTHCYRPLSFFKVAG